MRIFIEIIYWLLLTGVIASAAYYLFCIYSASRFFRSSEQVSSSPDFTPLVSILKPVRGVDARAYDCFASFCRQDYSDYEIVFGVRDAGDPAIKLIERLRSEFPDHKIKLVVNPSMIGARGKVSNL